MSRYLSTNDPDMGDLLKIVTASGDIREAPDLPQSVAGHRVDYWRWVHDHAEPTRRRQLLALRDHWRDCNARYFGGRMLEPYITITEPSAPQILGQCCSVSSWGSRLEIKIRPSLLHGTHPLLRNADTEARLQFARDVLLHEMVHQHVMEHQPDVNEESYHGHGPVFTGHCNRIGALLGLPEVVVRNRNGHKNPKSAQWPHNVTSPERYGGKAEKRTAPTKPITIPLGHQPVAITAFGADGVEVEWEPDADEPAGPTVKLRLHVDAAAQLADLMTAFLDDDDNDNE